MRRVRLSALGERGRHAAAPGRRARSVSRSWNRCLRHGLRGPSSARNDPCGPSFRHGADVARPTPVAHRMLIVDDEPAILSALAAYFRRMGFVVDCAGERQAAEGLITAYEYDCVIADLRLSSGHGAEGLAVVSRARQRSRGTRIIVLTAYGGATNEDEARRLGADLLLHKPRPLPEVARIVRGLLAERAS